jgi:hypothetical protein
MSATRPTLAWLLVASSLLSPFTPGCGPSEVANSPEIYNFGTLEEVGGLYLSASNLKKKPPTSIKDLAKNRDVFMNGYNALERGEVVVYWGVTATPGDPAGTADEVLAYKADVPTNGGPVLLKNLTIKTMTAEQFRAAPKPAGPTSSKAAGESS